MMKHNPRQISSVLERYRGDVSRCVRCGACKAVCPSFLLSARESLSARGRMALVEAVLDGRLSASGAYRDRLATCVSCLACEAACAGGVPVTEIIQAAKEQAVEEAGPRILEGLIGRALKREGLMQSLAWLAPVAMHLSSSPRLSVPAWFDFALHHEPVEWSPRRSYRPAKGRVVFFPGCAVRYFQRDIEDAAMSVLSALGYETIVPHELKCCGRPLLSLGDRKSAEELALHNARLLASFKADAVVTACASCGLTFKKEYSKLLAATGAAANEEAFHIIDIHEFLAGKLAALELEPLRARVTWHDPCHLGRGQGLAGTARDVLRSIAGVDLVEMSAPDRCCGFGGVMRVTHPELSIHIGAEKARDIMETGAPLVATGCPGCRMQMQDALRRSGSDAVVVHTVQLLAEAVHGASRPRRRKWVGGKEIVTAKR